MNIGLSRFLPGLFCLLAVFSGYGQKAFITVIDQKSREPVGFCHVCFEGISSGTASYSLTTTDGRVPNEVREPSKVAISYVGYKTYNDTVMPGETVTIELRPAVLNMDEVVVTAQYSPERADKSIYRIEVINSRQIEQKAAVNMAELLKDQPSMRVGQDAIFGTTLRIQGLSGENVKFLMDGIPLIGRMNGNFDLNQINLYNVDHVEIIEGPMSVIYGSNALAGVINIITKQNRQSALNVTANSYVESVGVFNFDGSASVSRKKHGISIDGGRNFFSGYSLNDEDRSQTFKPRRQYFFNGYYSFTDRRFRFKIAGDYFNERLLDQGSLQPPYYETAFDNDFITVRYSIRSDASINLPKHQFISLLASWSSWDRRRQTWFNDLTTLTKTPVSQPWAQDTSTIYSSVFRGSFSKNNPSGWFNYQAGIDLNHEIGMGEKIEGNRQEMGDYAAFVSMRFDPVKSARHDRVILSIQPGMRIIYNTRYSSPLVYALSVKWAATQATGFRFSFSRGFRAPSIKELYLSFVDFNHDIKGNPDLTAESSYNLGINMNYDREIGKIAVSTDITGFYNIVDNVIMLAQTAPNTASYTYRNISRYRTTGVQVETSLALYPALTVQAGFTFTGVSGTLHDSIPFEPYRWSPEVTLSPAYRFPKQDITLSIFYKFTGSTPQLGFEDQTIGWYTVGSYNTMDLTASKSFWNGRIKLTAGVKNIFNTTTVPTTGSAFGGGHSSSSGNGTNIAWGRTLFARLIFQFNKYK